MPSPNEITVSQLARLIGTPDAPIIVDLCIDEDFALDPRLIPTSFRHSFTDTASLAEQIRGKHAVFYCQKGKKISQGAAAIARSLGIRCEILVGGQHAWRDAKLPMVPAARLQTIESTALRAETSDPGGASARSVWVTRHRPKIDRIACPWLIRRFVDPTAKFLFVSPSSVLDVAEKFNATAFDVEGVYWSHRGEQCTFDTMVAEFELSFDALATVATIVRGADTDQLQLAPQAAGLLAMSLGLSRMYRDDLAQLNAGMLLYDAFYRWARDATDEGHDWPAVTAKN